MSDAATYETIRRMTANMRADAARLHGQVSAKYFKERLAITLRDLDEVNSFVLHQAEQASTPLTEAMWLNAANLRLQMADAAVEGIQKAVDKYGYDAEVIGENAD
jgi:hypothetical protein